MKPGEAKRLIKIFFLRTILCRRKREKRKPGGSKEERQLPVDDNRCSCCLRPFLLGRGVRCNDCGGRSCRKSCSRWDTSDNAWHCLFCHQQRLWLKKNGLEDYGGQIDEADLERYFNTAKSQVYLTGVENAATSSGSCLAREEEEANTMETVRDFVEKIIEGLIGSVEDTPIDRLYDHPACKLKNDKLLEKYNVPLVDALTRLAVALELSLKNKQSTDSTTMAQTALRDIVERAVDEARKLPSLGSSGEAGRPPEGRGLAENSYEDLLATAILNKVIEKFQKEQVDGNSNVLHGKPVSANKCSLGENETGLDESVEEGCSSLDQLSQDDCSSECSAACFKRVKNQLEPTVSLMIEERIEEVTTTYASDEEPKENDVLPIRNAHRVPFPELGMDIIDPSQESSEDSQDEPDTPTTHIGLISPVESWEENWLFQKKRVQTQADPVAMLVPNPSADYKALIGDKDAEDTSDLSECSSAQSDEEIEKELMEAINNVVPRSPERTGFENGIDHRMETLNDDSNQNHMEMFPEDTLNRKNGSLEKTESNGQSNRVQNGEMNGYDEAKEVEIERQGKLVKKIDTKSMNFINDDSRKIEVEGFKEGVEMNDSTDLKSSEREENSLGAPKTPTSTPTWTFVADINYGNTEDKGIVLREENILNSLECAKQKLMAVNDDIAEAFKEEEADAQQKADFHAEDIQQESEYTEHYDTATQRHLDSLTKLEASEQVKSSEESTESRCREAAALAKAESVSHTSLKSKKSEEEVRLAAPPRPGSIAEREHKKWENAPPIQNNPYSEENIQKRLWERQYSRRSSDIPGIHTELPKSNGENLDVVLTPHEPDIKRFGRDYYINHSRASSNEKGRRSAASTSSRPSSSLSQGSSSTGPDQDQQEETRYRETEVLLNRSNDVKSKVAKWQNNNAENKYQFAVRSADNSNEAEKVNEMNSRKIDRQRAWEDQRMEEILENERKNNKNEINAKLNNQENYDSPVIETKKNSEENTRKIKRIDLKAYGFENEFFSNGNKTIKTSAPRVVNKLDLKSFGYDGGIRRTQSNIQLNSMGNDDFKPRIVRVTNKSNLTRHRDYGKDRCDLIETQASGDHNLTQSTEDLNKFHAESFNGFGLKSAKSVPNIAKFYSNTVDSREDEEVESQSSYDFGIVKNGSVRNIANNYNLEKCHIRSDDCSVEESENDTDNSSEKGQRSKKILNQEDFDNKVLPMPSVRRLAEAFSKQSEHDPVVASKGNKSSNVYKERSSTPEIQIIESPRQMHSLTARSLSKQFREGLRQIPNKVTSPPASHVTIEQGKPAENQPEVVQAKTDSSNDINVILPGKLKSNIIFWEQMQRRS
ncbi:uncharacterized protein LOC117602933 isoform X3 [Osmia lignaria lignaria]|uniref:uncharacterized protein LOC117602933 isoform X3 n=1 Tax=Osmia lignaria lignaria TaxID=1437193 RepID=UPI00402B44ED